MSPNPQPKCEASWSVNIKGRYRTKQWKQSTGSSLRLPTLECGYSVMPETRFCERDVEHRKHLHHGAERTSDQRAAVARRILLTFLQAKDRSR